MLSTAILGLQWGDEGKGKLVDQLCSEHDVCVRFQGGGNAGHTVYPDGRKVVLHHLPTGVLHKQCLNILGPGMVVDPHKLLEEIDELAKLGYKLAGRLVLSDRASITTAIHTALDAAREGDSNKIGTTKRGIGPTYADRYDRIAVRACDLLDKQSLREALERALAVRGPQLGSGAPKADELVEPLLRAGSKLKPFIADSALVLYEALKEEKRVLYEGAQGALLDVAYGTYPYVTSSHTLANGISAGVGLQTGVDRIIGVTKAYCTRVGEGPFPTELGKAESEVLRQKGGEFGATTGRPRRVGHIDLFALRYVCRLSGVTELAVTKLDVLSNMGELKLGIGYEGHKEAGLPADIRRFAALKPVYKAMPGWTEDLGRARKGTDLPKAARAYLRFIEEFVGVKIGIISVGPERESAFAVKGAPKG
ncbi:adenylosuccinate synthase [Planctomycetaceae bacterium]|nr:adenylosuccinate synthase [Planctomycetaceae bacterium]